MAAGSVKWFNNAKGYGFVCVEGVSQDILVHHTVIQMEGYRTLKAGQPVLLAFTHGEKGLQAACVIPADNLTPEQYREALQIIAAAEQGAGQQNTASTAA